MILFPLRSNSWTPMLDAPCCICSILLILWRLVIMFCSRILVFCTLVTLRSYRMLYHIMMYILLVFHTLQYVWWMIIRSGYAMWHLMYFYILSWDYVYVVILGHGLSLIIKLNKTYVCDSILWNPWEM